MSRLPRPIAARGATTARWSAWRARQRALVMRRCRGACEVPRCPNEAVEAHHCYGRRNVVGEPLASHAAMLAGLCRGDHRTATVDPAGELAERLRRVALERAMAAFGVTLDCTDTFGAARALEDRLRESGEWERLREEAGVQ